MFNEPQAHTTHITCHTLTQYWHVSLNSLQRFNNSKVAAMIPMPSYQRKNVERMLLEHVINLIHNYVIVKMKITFSNNLEKKQLNLK